MSLIQMPCSAFQYVHKNDKGVDDCQGHQMVPYILKRYINILITLQTISLPWAPDLNNTRMKCLLRVISYIWSKSIDDPQEMPIRAANNFSLCHKGFKCFEYFYQSRV